MCIGVPAAERVGHIRTYSSFNLSGHALRYWEDHEQTQSVMIPDEEGRMWMHTGDEGMLDTDGYLRSQSSSSSRSCCNLADVSFQLSDA